MTGEKQRRRERQTYDPPEDSIFWANDSMWSSVASTLSLSFLNATWERRRGGQHPTTRERE